MLQNPEVFYILLVLTAFIEALVYVVKMVKEGEQTWKHIFAFFGSGLLLWLFGIDLVAMVGLTFAVVLPVWLYTVLTSFFGAVLIVRYSGNVNDLFDWVNGLRQP